MYLDVYEGLPRSKNQIDSTAGAVTGEANRQANKGRVKKKSNYEKFHTRGGEGSEGPYMDPIWNFP